MSAPLVAVEGLHRSFRHDPLRRLLRRRERPPLRVLRGVDVRVEAGDWLAVMGANGAGKTTLLKIIAGLLLPSAGSVRVVGRDVTGDGRAVRDAVGYVLADERSFHWRLTARENLRFFAALESLGRGEAGARIETLLAGLDLVEDADRPVYEFSSGMRQRLAIARALLKRPRVLLMDEPTRSVDAVHAAAVWPLVREELARVNGCAILVTHYVQDAFAHCSRLTTLEEGVLRERSISGAPSVAPGRQLAIVVRGLRPDAMELLRGFHGVEALRLGPGRDGAQVLEVATDADRFSPHGFIAILAREGAVVTSLESAAEEVPPDDAVAAGAGADRGA